MIHIEQQWAENYRTTAGELMHKKAHEEGSFEKRGGLLIVRGLRISSRELGLSGQCDVVEFRQDESGVDLFGYDGKWKVTPIEYKRGMPKENNADEVLSTTTWNAVAKPVPGKASGKITRGAGC